MVFQDPFGSLNPRMTVSDIVGEGLLIMGESRAAERVSELLDVVGLPQEAGLPVSPRVLRRAEAEDRDCQGAGGEPLFPRLRRARLRP